MRLLKFTPINSCLRGHVITLILVSLLTVDAQYSPSEICQGTYQGLTGSRSDVKDVLSALQVRYARCRKVVGNLELVFGTPPRGSPIWSNASAWEFLNNIVEVTGYVIVARSQLTSLPLRSLQLIGGQYLFQPTRAQVATCSLCIIQNPSLRSFGFQKLTEISKGDVYISGSPALGHLSTVNWIDLFVPRDDEETPQELRHDNLTKVTATCHAACAGGNCFGPSEAECHYSTRLTCNGCSNRCRPQQPTACCNQMCVGGCYNTSDNGCVACQSVRDGGRCVSKCPEKFTRDHRDRPVLNPNYKVAYAGECLKSCPSHLVDEGGECYTQCKTNFREESNGTCVICRPGERCPTYCEGNDIPNPKRPVTADVMDYMNSNSIKRFANCTHVSGNILIVDTMWQDMTAKDLRLLSSVEVITGYVSIQMTKPHSLFTDYSFLGNLTTIHGRYLTENLALALFDVGRPEQLGLRKLQRISYGNVAIRQWPCNGQLVNWTRLFNVPSSQKYSISSSTSSPCSTSYNCSNVCDEKAGCWGPDDNSCVACRHFRLDDKCVERCESPDSDQKYFVNFTGSTPTCEKCHPQCAQNCTGPNANQCVGGCRNFEKNGVCVDQCGMGFWAAQNRTCYPCHTNCEKGCNGPNEYVATNDRPGGCFDCFRTIVFRNGTKTCGSRVTTCEVGYATDAKGADAELSGVLCTQCELGCYDCASNARTCQVCEQVRIVRYNLPPKIPAVAIWSRLIDIGYSVKMEEVLSNESSEILLNYSNLFRSILKSKPHALEEAQCGRLSDAKAPSPRGANGCQSETLASFFMIRPKFNLTCVNEILATSDSANEQNSSDAGPVPVTITSEMLNQAELRTCRTGDNLCIQCAIECRDGCIGPTTADCNNCTVARLYHDEADRELGFECVLKCPDDAPWLWEETYSFCSAEKPPDEKRKTAIIVSSICIVVVLVIVAVIVTVIMLRRRAHDNMQTLKFEREMAGVGAPEEPLLESHIPPDMASLRLIKVTELKIGEMIGSGAFGVVTRGLWLPEGEKVKVPVAIKELTESSAKASAEFLEEVRVMATVAHPCCVRIVGLCMGEKPLVVTPLMRYGSLLDYIRSNESSLTARTLLTWSMQIAMGMSYLESRSIVHRDLAARNVLVQNLKQVKITDFGLAKLVGDQPHLATGGKLPVKWLAVECITERKFTHKSDVWAFGVTLWEMFTFGERPYVNTSAFDMLALLQRGDRLEQPPICTIDVYTVMLKCWFHEPSTRPSFRELSDVFARMSRDPGHYLHIETDKQARPPTYVDSSAMDDDMVARMLGACGDDSMGETRELMQADDYLCPLGPADGTSEFDTSASGSAAMSGRVIMSELQRNSEDLPPGSLPPDYYAAQSPAPMPPNDEPPPPPAEGAAGSRYTALENPKGRLGRLKGGRMDSIDGRYALDPVQFVSELERETERNRQGGAGPVQMRHHPAAAAAAAKNQYADEDEPAAGDAGDYVEPKALNQADQSSYMEMQSPAKKAERQNGVQSASAQRQTAPASAGDTKPKVPMKAPNRVKTMAIPESSRASVSTAGRKSYDETDHDDTYLVPETRPVKEAQEAYVNLEPVTQKKPNNRLMPAGASIAVQNPDYFVGGNLTAPKAVADDEYFDEENDVSYVNMDSDAQKRLLRS